METYYSQHGEDFLINKIFKGKTTGYYVEIGCLDGIEFSNTYFFERIGWKGVCIEAHQDFIVALKKNRAKAFVVHCAVGELNKESVTFYANKLGSLSTLDKTQEDRWKTNYKDYFYGFDEQKVPMRTLTSIFDDLQIQAIDFISLDIEGYEVQALEGLDFNKYKPTVFIIEYKDETHQQQLERILIPQGYFYLSKIGCNLFYSLEFSHKKVVVGPYGKVPLLQIEMGGREIWHNADHLNPTFERKLESHLKRSLLVKGWRYLNTKYYHFIEWLKIPSYEKKRSILEHYRQKFNMTVFVETGTFLGDTVAYFKNRFDHLYSIELSEELYEGATKRFENDSNITLIQGDSSIALKELVTKIDRPALFWLDGHYSSEFYIGERYIKTARGEKVTPIVEELEILLNDKHRHVILIDDARLFNGQWDYPKIEEVSKLVQNSSFNYKMNLRNDIIRIVPST